MRLITIVIVGLTGVASAAPKPKAPEARWIAVGKDKPPTVAALQKIASCPL